MPLDDRELRPGDRVQLTRRITGEVVRIVDDMAEVSEDRLLGRPSIWRVKVAALRPVVPRSDVRGCA